jgi:hypothetical protein
MRQLCILVISTIGVTGLYAQTLQQTLETRGMLVTRRIAAGGSTGAISLLLVRARAAERGESSGVEITVKESAQKSRRVPLDRTELTSLAAAITRIVDAFNSPNAVPDIAYVTKSGFNISMQNGASGRYLLVRSAPNDETAVHALITVQELRQFRELIIAAKKILEQ